MSTRLTLLDVVKKNSGDAAVGLIEEILTDAPELSIFVARSIRGTSYKTLHRIELPTTGFRMANEGMDASKSRYELRTVEAYIFGGRIEVDRAVARASEDGVDALLADEAVAVARSAAITLGSQIYYGTVGAGSKGFPGLQQLVDASMVHDATGNSAGAGSSIYGVRFGEQAAQLVVGQEGQLALDDFREESVADADGKKFTAFVSEMTAWIGLQCTHVGAVGRIKNITDQDGKRLDDDMIATWLEKFPASRMPEVIFMPRRARAMLRNSRTATNPTGAPAPFPESAFGIPIVTTDSLRNNEAIA